MPWFIGLILPVGIILVLFLIRWFRVLNEYERGVVFRLGRLVQEPVGPGLIILLAPPFIDKMHRVDLRTVTLDVPPQDVITKDNVSIKVNAVVYYRVLDPNRAISAITDYPYATSQMAQTTLRSIVGQATLDELLSEREKISNEIQSILDLQTDPWGIKVSNVEIKHVDLPADMQRAMARQAEAERERRAKIISAEGELQAAEKLVQAAEKMHSQPMALQMRYLQTVVEVGAEKNSTILFPLPMEILEAFSGNRKNQ
jgi:regulator of protease activity HflC (stomatin/prohibitin superfamily)